MYLRLSSLLAAVTLLANVPAVHAQNKDLLTNETLMKSVLQQSSFPIDTSARAVVLYHRGEAIVDDSHLTYKVEKIVKVISPEAAGDVAEISIAAPYGTTIRRIKGETFNLENDVVTKQSIEKTDVLSDETTKFNAIRKFNLPSVKAGSVVHYTYIVERWARSAPDWNFQNQNYPTLYSEYAISQPSSTEYTPIANSSVPFKKVKSDKDLTDCDACFTMSDYGFHNKAVATWVRRNVPSFKPEPFMCSENNYLERVKLRLISYTSAYGNWSISYASDWKKLSESFLKEEEGFGQSFGSNSFLNEKVKQLTASKTTELDKAKAIFAYVRDSIALKESSYTDISALSDIKDVFKKREGNIAGMNLLLVAMLRNAGLESQLVLLSTRSQERLNPLVPNPESINYVAAKVKAGGTGYFLDASEKYMPFGILDPQCYNGYCRIIDKTPVAAELHPDDLLEKNVFIVSLLPDTKATNKLLLKVDHKFGDVSGANLRSECKGDTAKLKEKIIKSLNLLSLPAKLSAYSFGNLNNIDVPLTLHYEAVVDWEPAAELVYLDPYFEKLHDKNPFTTKTRKYPVELDYLSDTKYIFRFQLPAGYVLDDYPKSRVYNFGDNEAIQLKNMLAYDEAGKTFSLECRYAEKTTVYPPESYPQLQVFHDNVIAEQQKKIVLKKVD